MTTDELRNMAVSHMVGGRIEVDVHDALMKAADFIDRQRSALNGAKLLDIATEAQVKYLHRAIRAVAPWLSAALTEADIDGRMCDECRKAFEGILEIDAALEAFNDD